MHSLLPGGIWVIMCTNCPRFSDSSSSDLKNISCCPKNLVSYKSHLELLTDKYVTKNIHRKNIRGQRNLINRNSTIKYNRIKLTITIYNNAQYGRNSDNSPSSFLPKNVLQRSHFYTYGINQAFSVKGELSFVVSHLIFSSKIVMKHITGKGM